MWNGPNSRDVIWFEASPTYAIQLCYVFDVLNMTLIYKRKIVLDVKTDWAEPNLLGLLEILRNKNVLLDRH